MELSPLAKERLAKIGTLSQEERERIRQSSELDSMLSQYFKGDLSSEDLWKELKSLKEQSNESIVKEAQSKLVDTVRLQMSRADFEQHRSAILALETIKGEGKYSSLELVFSSIEALRHKYTQTKEQAYEQLKGAVERQLQAVAQQAMKQGMNIDVESSVDANIKNSPQWKDFISKHEESCGEMFNSYIAKLRELI
jgi:ribosomal protein S13